MQKKNTNKHGVGYYKIDKKWAILFIDLIIGPELIILATREPQSAQQLGNMLIDFVLTKASDPEFKDKPELFIERASEGVVTLWTTYISSKLLKYLVNGVPKQMPQIIQAPSNIIM
jgi:hypothetical protein